MAFYYLIYILVLASVLFEFSEKKTKLRVLMFWCVFFALLGGLRWEIGGDWNQYYWHFRYSSWRNIFSYDRYGTGSENLEPGFVFFNILIKSIFGKFYIYNLIICSFLQYTFYRFTIKFSPEHPILFYSYMAIAAMALFPVRNGFSIGFVFWAIMAIRDRNFLRFLLFSAIASSIHYQCLIIFPFYWIYRIKLPSWTYILLYIGIIMMRYIFEDYIGFLATLSEDEVSNKLETYTQITNSGHAVSYSSWVLHFLLLLSYLYIRRIEKLQNDAWYNTLLNAFIVYMSFFIVFSESMGTLSRLTAVVAGFNTILYINMIVWSLKNKSQVIAAAAISFYIAFNVYKISSIAKSSNGYFEQTNVPYKTIFDYKNVL